MVRLTTHYDKSIKKKVYQVRGDESYAHTTDVSLVNSTILDGRMKGFKTDLTATIYRGMGASTVLFYDGEDVIGQEHISDGTSTVTLSDVYLSWIYPHELYVRYLGNDNCLSSKSKKLSLQQDLPDDLKIVITDNTVTHQYTHGSDVPIDAILTMDDEPIDINVDVKVYVDDVLADTFTSEDEVLVGDISGISDGKHTIRLVVEDSPSVHGSTLSYDIKVGYKVDLLSYSSPYIVGGTNSATVQVLDYDNIPVNSGTVTIGSDSGTTNSNGVATISLTSYSATLTASYNGSTSTSKTNTSFTPSGITISGTSTTAIGSEYAVKGHPKGMSVNVNGTGDSSNIPITVTYGNNTIHTTTDNYGSNYPQFTGTGSGDVTCTASIDGTNISDNTTINDLYSYVNGGNVFNFNPTYDATSTFTQLQNYCRMRTTTQQGSTGISGSFSLRKEEWNPTSSYRLSIRVKNFNFRSIGFNITGNIQRRVSISSDELNLSGDCVIHVEVSSSSVVAKVNNRTIVTNTQSDNTVKLPVIVLVQPTSTGSYAQLDFDLLQIKKLS